MIINTLHKTAWLVAGSAFLVLALIGLILPIIPQVPFFLAALFCFMRGSKRFHGWMHRQRWFVRIKSRLARRRK
jgi:uncharacterized protein